MSDPQLEHALLASADLVCRAARLNAQIAAMQAHDRSHPDTPYTEGAYDNVLRDSGVGVNDVTLALRYG